MAVLESRKLYTMEEFDLIREQTDEILELINGEIYAKYGDGTPLQFPDITHLNMASPGKVHQLLVMRLGSKIDSYILKNNGKCQTMIAPFDVKLNHDIIVIPDVMVICDPSKLTEKRCIGSPDWIIEILSSNRDDDLIRKQALYKNNNVREYWIVDPKNEKTLVYFFEKNDLPDIYTFDTPVPVEIYDRKLTINIAELLEGKI